MMEKKVLFFLLILACFCIGQAQRSDSLWEIYNNKAKPDTVRLIAIRAIAWGYSNVNTDSAIFYAEKEKQLAVETKRGRWEAGALNIVGVSYMNTGNYPAALEYYFKALGIYEAIKYKKGIGNCQNNIGL